MEELLVDMEIILLISKMFMISRSPRGGRWIYVSWMCLYIKEEEGLELEI